MPEITLLLDPDQAAQLALLPDVARDQAHIKNSLAILQETLLLTYKGDIRMSKALDDKLHQLSTTADQVVDILSTDASSLAALQASVDALKAAQGDDSAEVAKAQAILDKLTTAVTPVDPAPAPVDTPVVDTPVVDAPAPDAPVVDAPAVPAEPDAPAPDAS